ncbi:hypothetical protein FPQ18DRAFT_352849 [Pyronema domesticum]|uniref:Similar to Uncharacterized protein YLL056C acc. no. Q12177 n=1 Tax=Pyronema omphalodes (strain CBS 100304) TaxID=1076935 RepID=U4KUI6_PYROM|nr:hypothetical protein FPQ18DRAFT_352849 [Pyronema domesticum]CCX04391.1 Similar to Uncharacterized protein YLL056C; acc. no. Q12177 [Pyronema omphalodes CBS 100304]
MAAPKIFATGTTGYIGGTALELILRNHPDYQVTALVRDENKAAALRAQHPTVKTVIGTLDSLDVIEAGVSDADIVLHFADCDHVPSATTIVNTLSKASSKKFLIHTSGSAILADCTKPELFGEPITKDLEYADISTRDAITSFPIDGHPHRDVDVLVLAAPSNVNTAIVCPPCIYGTGTGSGNTKSMQVPLLINRFLKRGKGFTVQKGKSEWNNVHVCDLAKVYLALTEAAVAGGEPAQWNENGYYFAENGRHTWEDLSKEIAQKCKDMHLLPTDEIDYLDNEEILKLHPFGHVAWGTNSIGKAERAKKLFDWTPDQKSLSETLVESIQVEAKALGLSF